METGPQPSERRIERVRFEMDRHVVVGDVMLPPDGYQSRFSDSMNRPDFPFLAVVNAEVTPIEGIYGMIPPAGYPLKKLAPHIELFARKVMPAFQG